MICDEVKKYLIYRGLPVKKSEIQNYLARKFQYDRESVAVALREMISRGDVNAVTVEGDTTTHYRMADDRPPTTDYPLMSFTALPVVEHQQTVFQVAGRVFETRREAVAYSLLTDEDIRAFIEANQINRNQIGIVTHYLRMFMAWRAGGAV